MSSDTLALAVTASQLFFGTVCTTMPVTFANIFGHSGIDTPGARTLVRCYGAVMLVFGGNIAMSQASSAARRHANQVSAAACASTVLVHLFALANGDVDAKTTVLVTVAAGMTGLLSLLSAMR